MCFGFLCCVCCLIILSSPLHLWFLICGLFQVLLLRLVVNFCFSIAFFLLLPLDKMCSKVHILNSYGFCGAQWLKVAHFKGYTRLDVSLPENGYGAAFWNVPLKNLDHDQVPKNKFVSVNLSGAVFLFWISLLHKMGLIGCPKMSAGKYHSTPCNISEKQDCVC